MVLNNRLIFVILCCLLLVVFTKRAWTAEDTVENSQFGLMLAMSLEELVDMEVELASGTSKPINLAPAVASVITAKQIEAMGATTLDEVIESVPGLHVTPSGLNLFTSNYAVRGINTKLNPHVLLLINGTPLTRNYSGGRPQTYQMPVSMISRVEVIRGPGSAIYGADAFSGVINVISKDNHDIDGTKVGVRYGSFGTHDAWLQHGAIYRGWDFWASLESQKTDGAHDRIVDQDRIPAVLSNAPGYLDTQYDLVESHLGFSKNNFSLKLYGSIHNDNGIGPGAWQALNYTSKIDGKELMADFIWRDRKFQKNWDLALHMYSVYMKTDNYLDLAPHAYLTLIGNPITTDKYSALEGTVFYKGFDHHVLRLSMGTKFFDTETEAYQNFIYSPGLTFIPYRQITSDEIYMVPQNRSLWFGSIQDEWQIAKAWSMTGGFRFDDYSDFGSTLNPRVALVWEARYDLSAKLLYGSAFRAPAFVEQYGQNNPLIIANANVQPETIDTYELAFDYQPLADLRTSLNLFYYRAEEMVEVIATQTDNYSTQEGRGFEIGLDWQATANILVRSNFAYQRSKNKTDDSIVPDTPEMQFYLNPHWEFLSDWSLDGQLHWVGGRHRAASDPRADIDDYELVNLTIRRKNIAGHWDAALAVRNLFDEDAREPSPYEAAAPQGAYIPSDYPMQARSIWGELRYTF